jgi:O-glycosyl hydrolase
LPLNIDVDANVSYQEYLGVGAAFTDATAQLFQMRLSTEARQALLRELMGPPPGLGLNLMRVPIGATDFSSAHYSLDDRPRGETDQGLAHFALGPHGERLLSLVRAAHEVNPQLRLIASPWSAPAWMKNTGSLIAGRLLPQYYDAFADYLLRFADEYRRAGVPLYALTVQNEPGYEPDDYLDAFRCCGACPIHRRAPGSGSPSGPGRRCCSTTITTGPAPFPLQVLAVGSGRYIAVSHALLSRACGSSRWWATPTRSSH